MKLLTVAVPCYNSQAYMKNCIESLLVGGSEVEILIVDDGSTDDTPQIADAYAEKYPNIVRVVHQPNGGHGEAVNTGIREATGLYYKVVDSDDWVDIRAYHKVLDVLRAHTGEAGMLDLLVCNYVYEREGAKYKRVIQYGNVLPENEVFGWDDVGKFHVGQYLLMHSVIYRTGVLRESGLVLPKHTFYVDNLFVFLPLVYVKKIYYINADFYRYYIGREDQSVHEDVMIKRIDQQILVNKLMLEQCNISAVKNERLRNYLINYFEIITGVSSILLIRSGAKENLQKKRDLWAFIKKKDPKVHYKIRNRVIGTGVNLPGFMGRKMALLVYRAAHKKYGFN